MAKVIEVMPDPFQGQGTRVADFIPAFRDRRSESLTKDQILNGEKKPQIDKQDWEMAGQMQTVSRPVGGISIKPNTYAFVQIIDKRGKVVKVFNKLGVPLDSRTSGDMRGITYEVSGVGGKYAPKTGRGLNTGAKSGVWEKSANSAGIDKNGNPASYVWTDWLLQSVREERVEKTQLVETFGDSYLFVFGQKPRALVFTGLLMNTQSHQWKAAFWENWDRFFRATKLVERDARMYISFDDVVVEGYPINAQASQSSTSPNAITFQFNFFDTKYINIEARDNFKSSKKYNLTQVSSGNDLRVSKDAWKDNRLLPFSIHNVFASLPAWGQSKLRGKFLEDYASMSAHKRIWATAGTAMLGQTMNMLSKTAWIAMGSQAADYKDYYLTKQLASFTKGLTTTALSAVYRSTAALWDTSIMGSYSMRGIFGGSTVNQLFGAFGEVMKHTHDKADWPTSSPIAEATWGGSISGLIQATGWGVHDAILGTTRFGPEPTPDASITVEEGPPSAEEQ